MYYMSYWTKIEWFAFWLTYLSMFYCSWKAEVKRIDSAEHLTINGIKTIWEKYLFSLINRDFKFLMLHDGIRYSRVHVRANNSVGFHWYLFKIFPRYKTLLRKRSTSLTKFKIFLLTWDILLDKWLVHLCPCSHWSRVTPIYDLVR